MLVQADEGLDEKYSLEEDSELVLKSKVAERCDDYSRSREA